jgi:ureidoglycolate lyase
MSMFSCFPRKLNEDGSFNVEILERHPFTSQTFAPLGLLANDPETRFLVIVAPSLPDSLPATTDSGSTVHVQRPPDLCNLKAFVANGGQAVTYGPGTWHAPMVVLGKRRVDFVVTQFVSGVVEEDCQEVSIANGSTVEVASERTRPKL